MGIRAIAKRAAGRAADAVAKLAVLSPEQLENVQERRNAYLLEMPSSDDPRAVELTERLMAANAVEIYNAYLPQIKELYVPVDHTAEYERGFDVAHNTRYINVTRWVRDATESGVEKLVNVYNVLSDEECDIALIFHRGRNDAQVFLAVSNLKNDYDNVDSDNYRRRLVEALRGNFPGSEWRDGRGAGVPPVLADTTGKSVATVSNIPAEKSEKFLSQTIEKLLDGVVPQTASQEYTIVLLATPIQDVEERKLRLAEIYSGLAPYASWETSYRVTESGSESSGATVGLNVGASVGSQNGTGQQLTQSEGVTDSTNSSTTDSASETIGASESSSVGTNTSQAVGTTNTVSGSVTGTINASQTVGSSATAGVSIPGGFGHADVGVSESTTIGASLATQAGTSHATNLTNTIGRQITQAATSSMSRMASHAVQQGVGRAVASTASKAVSATRGHSLGANFGANFARSSTVTAVIGKDEGITQHFQNFSVKHALQMLEEQMKRYDESSALGMWDFAAYVLSDDLDVASNVAHSYLALTQGEKSHLSTASINLWRGDLGPESTDAREICSYLRELRQPLFGLNPLVLDERSDLGVYPALVNATTPLSGKELALALNFPKSSLPGFPVLECVPFGRSVTSYEPREGAGTLSLGKIFHMRQVERGEVRLDKESLTSHVFVTGSTGSGKSTAVYKMLDEAAGLGTKFLVIEPAKGEYKEVFGGWDDVAVYGTNPAHAELLRIDPFAFPASTHVLEHLDRLVEVFNVCWPMYAAMPAVLKDAVERSYVDCGWDLVTSANPYGEGLFPTFADVARNVRAILDESEYDAENKGAYKGSLLTRLNSLCNGINGMVLASGGLTDEELFDRNAIVDLSRVGSMETKALLMGILVLKLQEHRMDAAGGANQPLRHITVLEEAHNLLKRTSTEQTAEGGNLLGKSVEMLTSAIAEMRTYGEGFIIVDQAPGLLDMAAIRNTNTKVIMRLPDQADRELVGKAANLSKEQIREVARFPRGVAAVYQNEWVEPVLCMVEPAELGGGAYVPPRHEWPKHEVDPDVALDIAIPLVWGEGIDDAQEMRAMRDKIDALGLPASVVVATVRELREPTPEPRMTKLGPIMSALFPTVSEAVVESRKGWQNDPEQWTRSGLLALAELTDRLIAEQVRRDIIQAIVTDYVYNVQHDEQSLRDWHDKGGFR